MTYYRNSNNGPMSDWRHAMFTDNRDKIANMYGKTTYIYDGKSSVEIETLHDAIVEKWAINPAFEWEHLDAEEAYSTFCPERIVNSAEGYDQGRLVTWLWENILEPANIMAVITPDGAVVFDEDLIEEYSKGAEKKMQERLKTANAELNYHYALQRECLKEWGKVSEQWMDTANDLKKLPDLLRERHEEIDYACAGRLSQGLREIVQTLRRDIGDARIYHALQPALDPSCHELSHAAAKITGIDISAEFPAEDARGQFELCDGMFEIKYIDAAQFGDIVWGEVTPGYEEMKSVNIDYSTQEFSDYVAQRYTVAVNQILSKRIDTLDAIGALEGMKKIGSSMENTMETMHALNSIELEERWEKQAQNQYSTPIVERYTVDPPVGIPWDIDPVLPSAPQEPTKLHQMKEILNPELKQERLESELEHLSEEIEKVHRNVTATNDAIKEKTGEIWSMEESYQDCKLAINQGSAYNTWLREQFSELTAGTHMSADMVCFHNVAAVAKGVMQQMIPEYADALQMEAQTEPIMESEMIMEPGM